MRNFINIINESIGERPAADDTVPAQDTVITAPEDTKSKEEGFKARLEALMAKIAELKASVVEEDDGMNGATVPQNGSGTETPSGGFSGSVTTDAAGTSGISGVDY